MTEQPGGQVSLFGPDLWHGKTSPERCPPTKERISAPSSRRRAASPTIPYLYLCRKKGSGQASAVLWETVTPSPTGSSMLNTGECPNVVAESFLSQILQENVPLKYFLSHTACLGILRRAEKRGKSLPELLRIALERQAA